MLLLLATFYWVPWISFTGARHSTLCDCGQCLACKRARARYRSDNSFLAMDRVRLLFRQSMSVQKGRLYVAASISWPLSHFPINTRKTFIPFCWSTAGKRNIGRWKNMTRNLYQLISHTQCTNDVNNTNMSVCSMQEWEGEEDGKQDDVRCQHQHNFSWPLLQNMLHTTTTTQNGAILFFSCRFAHFAIDSQTASACRVETVGTLSVHAAYRAQSVISKHNSTMECLRGSCMHWVRLN